MEERRAQARTSEQKALFVQTDLDEPMLHEQPGRKFFQISGEEPAGGHSGQATRAPEEQQVVRTEAAAEADALPPPPPRRSLRIWPWLLIVLLSTAGAGFWLHRDAWMDSIWLRSSLANLGLPIPVRDKDWSIDPESVRATWVERDDGSRVMVIEGRVINRLSRTLPLPMIRVRYFAAGDPERVIRTFELPVTQPPLLDDIRHAPFDAPPVDALPVVDLGVRDFVLVIEDAPTEAGDFELHAVARQASGAPNGR